MHTQLLSGDYLFSSPSNSPSGYFTALTVALAVIFLASALVYWRRSKLTPNNAIMRRFLRRIATAGLWTAGTGLFLAAMRFLEVDYIDEPILMLLLILLMIVIVGYFVYDLSENYPLAIYRLQEAAVERRYRPQARLRTQPQRPPSSRPRGKRRK